MTTDPGDLVLDTTCGSGTTAFVAEQWGRRWMTCDTSRVALTLAKQRLMTAVFSYYRLAHDEEGVDSGFLYNSVPHVTLKSIANNEPPDSEILYDDPLRDNAKARVTGPFTVEAVPAPMVKSLAEISGEETAAPMPADESVSRSGETSGKTSGGRNCCAPGFAARAGR
jgi:adenine-specific DNA-methyltransferase